MNQPDPQPLEQQREPVFSDLFGLSADTFPKGIDPVVYIRALRDGDDEE